MIYLCPPMCGYSPLGSIDTISLLYYAVCRIETDMTSVSLRPLFLLVDDFFVVCWVFSRDMTCRLASFMSLKDPMLKSFVIKFLFSLPLLQTIISFGTSCLGVANFIIVVCDCCCLHFPSLLSFLVTFVTFFFLLVFCCDFCRVLHLSFIMP